jgi:hypothetical protein
MNMTIRKYAFWPLVLVILAGGVRSQELPFETVKVYTDRMMYISGEMINFSALVINNDDFSVNGLSRALCCELVTPDGTRISSGKYSIDNGSAQGSLAIPTDAISGIYYLKSYTKWMRNTGPAGYSYTRLKIINPDRKEVLASEANVQTGIEFTTWDPPPALLISTDKLTYYPRENVEVKITGYSLKDSLMKCILSVMPLHAFDSIASRPHAVTGRTDSVPLDIQYYPETRGVSLSGRLLNDKTGNPVPNAIVNLSIIGDKDVMAIRTTSDGRFYFSLPPYNGNRDIFLSAEELKDITTSVFIDNDFCPEPVSLPSSVFDLTEKEKMTAYAMSVNQMVNDIFAEDTFKLNKRETRVESAFYGIPDEILEMDRYIDLPTVEEYFSELLGSVNVRKYEGRTIFRFNSMRTEMLIFDPLILIDMVAVNDINKILAMSPRLISRIELVNSPYIKGNITYGGIISFFSKNSDFAGIDLPSSGSFINYQFLEEIHRDILQEVHAGNIPDARNTVYWNSDLSLEESGATEIRFTMPDTPGKYIIVFRGFASCGKDFEIIKEIHVADQ